MKTGAVYRVFDHLCLIPRALKTTNSLDRMRGLLGRPPLAADEGLWIDSCNMVHTVGMGYALDLIFLNSTGRVQKLAYGVKPFRFAGAWGARSTLELPAETLAFLKLKVGDQLTWQEVTL